MNKYKTPTCLDIPAFLMNFPFTVDSRYKNNALMNLNQAPYDYDRAYLQWMGLYEKIVELGGLVYILPSEEKLQDLPFVANIGCYLPHLKNDTIVVSNFFSPPRMGEEFVGVKFFDSMRYNTVFCPFYWEGEADLKWLYNNVYVSPYGMRTGAKAHKWFEKEFSMQVIPVELTDDKLYHLDCVLFPLDKTRVIVATDVLKSSDVNMLGQVADVIAVPNEFAYNGWTNVLKINNKILHASDVSNKEIETFYGKLGYETVPIPLDEFDKSGADLSCLIMNLNYK